MTAPEYAELLLATRDNLFAAIRAALPIECEMEKRFMQSETDWSAALVNKDTDKIRIFILLMNKLESANEEKTAGAKMFKPSMKFSFELFHDRLLGTDGDNTQTDFESDAIKLQFAIESNKSLPPKGFIVGYEINLGALPSKTRNMHYGRGEITINFRDIRYE